MVARRVPRAERDGWRMVARRAPSTMAGACLADGGAPRTAARRPAPDRQIVARRVTGDAARGGLGRRDAPSAVAGDARAARSRETRRRQRAAVAGDAAIAGDALAARRRGHGRCGARLTRETRRAGRGRGRRAPARRTRE